jgi:hypothetical protein
MYIKTQRVPNDRVDKGIVDKTSPALDILNGISSADYDAM